MSAAPGLPMVQPQAGMPSRITIYEVGARDGLQNESGHVPTEVKVAFIRRLLAAGIDTVELTSFVPARWVPQLGDAAEVMAALGSAAIGRNRPVLVPNERGLDRALESGAAAIAIFGSATETFSQRNLNRSVSQSIDMFAPVVRRALDAGVWVRGYVSMCFGDPWEGPVSVTHVVDVCSALMDLGCDQLSIGDTIGVATPGHVVRLIEALEAAGIGADHIGVHFHDTYGQALANTITALSCGVSVVDASAGGLGGCPYAESATGNLATEDLIWALDGLGIAHGINLTALTATSAWMAGQIGRPSPSRVVRALTG